MANGGEILWKVGIKYIYVYSQKKVFCFYCRIADRQGLLKAESTFTTIRFNNWKKALEKFKTTVTAVLMERR